MSHDHNQLCHEVGNALCGVGLVMIQLRKMSKSVDSIISQQIQDTMKELERHSERIRMAVYNRAEV